MGDWFFFLFFLFFLRQGDVDVKDGATQCVPLADAGVVTKGREGYFHFGHRKSHPFPVVESLVLEEEVASVCSL